MGDESDFFFVNAEISKKSYTVCMQKPRANLIYQLLFITSLIFIIYMPLHVFIVQSASLLTGGLGSWKAGKDILLFLLVPALLYLSYRRGLFKNKTFRLLIILGGVYAFLHLLFVLFDRNDDLYSAIVGSVYNTRLLAYLLLGYVVGSAKQGEKYLKYLLTATVLIATAVALFGVAQYFLPHDMLTHVGYSLDRGVKPLFFIDDKPDFPRVMSTLKDPNSLGAYLILPILLTGYALINKKVNEQLFARPFRRKVLVGMTGIMLLALFLTFSRGAVLGLILGTATMLALTTGKKVLTLARTHWGLVVATLFIIPCLLFMFRNTYVFQNLFFHADKSTVLEDPNELRITLTKSVVDDIWSTPLGHGPGTAGLVSINNPKGGVLTENYYLQIAYEVGWLGIALFVAILYLIFKHLLRTSYSSPITAIMLSSMIGYLFISLLIHLWSNESVALQFWLLSGAMLGLSLSKQDTKKAI